jgi:hypothetical protein
MAIRYDIALDANGDLPIGATLMGVAPSDERHLKDMIGSFPGEWKQFPQNGVGVAGYLKSTDKQLVIAKNVRQAMQKDGYDVGNTKITYDINGKLVIDAKATR